MSSDTRTPSIGQWVELNMLRRSECRVFGHDWDVDTSDYALRDPGVRYRVQQAPEEFRTCRRCGMLQQEMQVSSCMDINGYGFYWQTIDKLPERAVGNHE